MGKSCEKKSQGKAASSATLRQNKGLGPEKTLMDHRPEATAQRKLQEIIQSGANDTAQQKAASGPSEPLQREMKDEEKEIQGKFILQGKGLDEEESDPGQ